jgi:membrane protease YdiL (CAAX protease family)
MMKLHRFAPWLALTLFVLMGDELVVGYVARLLGVHGLVDITPQALLAMGAARYAAGLCLALFGVYAILQAPPSSIGLRLPTVAGLALGVAGGVAGSIIVSLLVRELRLQSSYNLQYEHYILSHATGLVAAALFLVFLVFGPIVEEIVFRGIVLGGLLNVTNGVFAVVVSAAVFAGIHAAGGVAQITGAFVLGLVLGWLYLRTRSIGPSSVAHSIYNAVAFYPIILYMVRANRF